MKMFNGVNVTADDDDVSHDFLPKNRDTFNVGLDILSLLAKMEFF